MWRMTAPQAVTCSGWEHIIAKGQPVLSDAPEELPSSINRGQLRHFHLTCQECMSGGCCYQTYAAKQPTEMAEEEAACAYCGEAIRLRQQFAYDYSLALQGEDGAPGQPSPGLGLLLGRIAPKFSPFEALGAATALRVGFLANPVVAWAGTGIFAVSTARRLINAWQESPLTRLILYFHPDCYQRYAAELSGPEMTRRGVIINP